MGSSKCKFVTVLAVFQVAFVVLFGLFTTYDDGANAMATVNQNDPDKGGADPGANPVKDYYPMFQDVHVMIFVGFGFLMTFLKRYGYGAVGLNFLIAAFVIQWAMLMKGFLDMEDGKIKISIINLLTSDFTSAAVLISFGAVLGKTSPLQLLIMAFLEVVFFSCNEYIGVVYFKAVDMGGSMFVHAFGAYFGLAVARVLYREDTAESAKEGSVYHSDLFSMIGTLFLWIYWPSFNAALAPGDDQQRAVINTYLALASCCVTTFIVSSALDKNGKFDMVAIQNATLAGGVAVGTSADMMIQPWGAVLIGIAAAFLSTCGFKWLTPCLSDKLKLHDTCGVNNLHGMPGILAGIAGAIATAAASESAYGWSLYEVYPARAPSADGTVSYGDAANGTTPADTGAADGALAEIQAHLSGVSAGDGRSAGMQAGYQMAALGVTLLIAIVTGAITGIILRVAPCDMPKGKEIFDDGPWYETPDDFNNESYVQNGHRMGELLQKGERSDQRV